MRKPDPGLIERLERLREARNIRSVRGFALRCGLSPTATAKYFNGTGSPGFESLEKIASAMNVSLDWLTQGKGSMDLPTETGDLAHPPEVDDEEKIELVSATPAEDPGAKIRRLLMQVASLQAEILVAESGHAWGIDRVIRTAISIYHDMDHALGIASKQALHHL